MEKSDFNSIENVPATLVEEVFAEDRNNRTLNSEGISVGDKITLVGLPEKLSRFTPEKEPGATQDPRPVAFCNLITKGDRANLSLGALVGTPKRNKYFGGEYPMESMEGVDLSTAATFPQREADAIAWVAKHLNTTFECIAVAEKCGKRNNRTFYLWREVK